MGLREFGGGLKFSGHVPGQEFFDPAERVVRDAAEHFAEPAFGIESIEAGCSQQRVNGSCTLAAAV